MTPRWTRRPPGSNWGDFGPDDQLGRLNLLTSAKVLQGVAEVREGIAFCLSLPLDYPGGNVLSSSRHPPVLRPTVMNGNIRMNYRVASENPDATDIISDDAVILHTQYSTQWDSLAHVGHLFDVDGDGMPEAVYYNGFRADEDVIGPSAAEDAGAVGVVQARSTSRANALGIERMAETGVQGRGVMIDLHAHVGRERAVVGYDALMRVLEQDRLTVEPGDMVCLHTGFAELLLEMGGRPDPLKVRTSCAVLNGRDQKLLDWITESQLAVLIADNFAVEAFPAIEHHGCCAAAPLHEHCLFKLGVHLGELWHLTKLASWLRSHGRSRFLLTAPPLRLPGAVGSPATPVATV
ncbi:MAG: cyclase family protein [Nevskiales bacterium]